MMSLNESRAYIRKLEDELRDARALIVGLRSDVSHWKQRAEVQQRRWFQADRSLARERNRAERAIAEMMRLRTYAQRLGISLVGFRKHKELEHAND